VKRIRSSMAWVIEIQQQQAQQQQQQQQQHGLGE
jgi:hypothetical protein